jgi:hypothetical protein
MAKKNIRYISDCQLFNNLGEITMKNVFRFFLAACFGFIAMIFGIVVMVATGTPHGAFSVSMTLFFALIGAVAGWYRVQ